MALSVLFPASGICLKPSSLSFSKSRAINGGTNSASILLGKLPSSSWTRKAALAARSSKEDASSEQPAPILKTLAKGALATLASVSLLTGPLAQPSAALGPGPGTTGGEVAKNAENLLAEADKLNNEQPRFGPKSTDAPDSEGSRISLQAGSGPGQQIAEKIEDVVQSGKQQAGGILNRAQGAADQTKNKAQDLIGQAQTAGQDGGNKVIEKAKDTGRDVQDRTRGLIGQAEGAFAGKDKLGKLRPQSQGTVNKAHDLVGSAKDIAPGGVSRSSRNMFGQTNVAAKDVINDSDDKSSTSIFGIIKDGIKGDTKFFGKAKESARDADRSSKNAVGQARGNAGEVAKDADRRAKGLFGQAQDAGKDAASGVEKNSKNLIGKTQDAAKDAAAGVDRNSKNLFGQAQGSAKNAASDVNKNSKDIFGQAQDAVKDAASDVGKNAKNLVGQAQDEGSRRVENAKDKTGNLVDQAKNKLGTLGSSEGVSASQ